ncbi:AzlD family protein [Pandoraea fibrosis]|uniref:AzlD family protein n=1 Tax=Pandoraea fibrosis TaxID=1891094 RepID=A0A5E4XDF9_9BURK|nr:AzlD family protein [Pandoraea fibrosis]QHE92279.1 AzlD family protein [Pandoraea fibrosis]QHF14164.1 AzlD family protein [Pandoraea fibrosis]VVE34316.1 membrane protein [Pandoraea fibrosis]
MPDLTLLLPLATVALMAVTTYATRIVGFLVLRDRTLSPRVRAVMESLPGCVLISVIAPSFVADRPADLMALALTLLAAMRFSLLPTVILSIVVTGALRYLVG